MFLFWYAKEADHFCRGTFFERANRVAQNEKDEDRLFLPRDEKKG